MSFEKSLSIEDLLADTVNEETRKASLSLLSGVILKTPVDEGEAQGSWQVALSTPTRKQRNKTRRADAALRDGKRVINSAKGVDYPTIIVTSNKPYMEKLNDGHSEQADPMFVEREIQRVADKGIGR